MLFRLSGTGIYRSIAAPDTPEQVHSQANFESECLTWLKSPHMSSWQSIPCNEAEQAIVYVVGAVVGKSAWD